jgi:hypothetical protein
MDKNIRLKDIYPVFLFIVLLMTWALVAASNPSSTITPLEWNKPIKSPKVMDSCKENNWPFASEPTCEERGHKHLVTPLFQKHDFKQLFSQLERKANLKQR